MRRQSSVTRERARLAREHGVQSAAEIAGVSEITIRRALRDATDEHITRRLMALLEPFTTDGGIR